MNKDEFINSISEFNIEITNDKLDKLDKYLIFLKEYNKHTNLTRIIDDNDVYLKHFYDSLTILKAIDLNNYNSLIDIGSGAGFPGMVLKIMFPHLDVTLLDSNNKKTKFLNELKDILNIDVTVINDRVENYSKNNLNKFDIVTSRAVANLRVLSELSLPLVKINGLFIPLKGNIEEELNEANSTINYFNAEIINKITFNLNNNAGIRNILVIKKQKETDINSIRSYDKILKMPLVKKN